MKISTSTIIGALLLLNCLAGLTGVDAKNGDQKCVKGKAGKYTEEVKGKDKPLEKKVPDGKKCCQSPKNPNRVVFQVPSLDCPCFIYDFEGQNFEVVGTAYNKPGDYTYKILGLAKKDSKYVQVEKSTGTVMKAGKFKGWAFKGSKYGIKVPYKLGFLCDAKKVPAKGKFTIVPTDDPAEQRVLTATEPEQCEYEFEMKCYQP